MLKVNANVIVVASALNLMAGSCVATTTPQFQCPREIQTEQRIAGDQPDWTASVEDTRYPLVSIRLSEGEPAGMAWLAPTESKGVAVQSWSLPSSKEGYWVSCGYGGTSVVLSRRLPEGIKKCTVWFDKDHVPPTALKYQCK